uniref:Formate/nitrite transporter n=1 Tax=Mycena chlorophos TaxID=658473 RepID=A0ABQ0M091_MYCCL|nr:formate/nitrite transporter [Mycena chlorophos]
MSMDASTLKPAEVAVYFVKSGIAKHNDRLESVFFKAFLAGVMLSFGGLLSEVAGGGSAGLTANNPGLAKLISGFVFPAGLVMIVLQGHELLTSNMMIFPMAVAKRVIPWWSLPLNWIIVTFGNLVGSLFFAAILVKYSGVLSADPFPAYVTAFAIKKAVEPEWHQIFLRGIGCNWLVCVAVWGAAGAKETSSKVIAIWIPIWLFVACSFDHVVANMFSIPLGIMFHAEGLTTAYYIRKSLIPAFLGNIIGALFVALPTTYFYLWDYDASGFRDAEAGQAPILNRDRSSSDEHSDNMNVKQD